jgi:PAS domain S-box-containing protein
MISVLYVDDDPSLLEISKLFLEDMGGFRIDTAESARSALDILRHRTYDAVISDYQMPGMNGIEFLQILRETFPPLPFIIFSGLSRDELAIRAFENGADVYLEKGGDPHVQYAELSHCIRKSVEHYQSRQALRENGARLRRCIQEASRQIGILDTEGRILYDSPSTPHLFGYPEQSLVGRSAIDLVHPEDRASVIDAFRGVQGRTPRGTPIGYRLRRADGTYAEAESMAMNFLGVEGVDGIVVITWPVSEDTGDEKGLRIPAN